jgi:hypothetical protein
MLQKCSWAELGGIYSTAIAALSGPEQQAPAAMTIVKAIRGDRARKAVEANKSFDPDTMVP